MVVKSNFKALFTVKKISIKYLSHGLHKTGGYRYEQFLFDEICQHYQNQNYQVQAHSIRKVKFYKSFFQHLYLFFWANVKAHANINIVVSRLALPSLLRNLFTHRTVFIVWHNYDENEAKSFALKCYYKCLFGILRNFHLKNIQIITGANYWVDFFSKKINHKNKVSYFPNLFDTHFYKTFQTKQKHNQIHLGQWHPKNDPAIFQLAEKLNQNGFTCYFCSLDAYQARQETYYSIKHFESFENYLQCMAESEYTLAFTQLNEGWNRLAHESILVGTSVIGFNKAGLGELLQLSNSFIVNSMDEAFDIIIKKQHNQVHDDFIQSFDKGKSEVYLTKLI